MIPSTLKKLRQKVETIDQKIVALLIARFKTTHKIQNLKREFGIKIHQKKRELTLLKKYLTRNTKNLPAEFLKKLFSLIFSYAKKTGIIKRS